MDNTTHNSTHKHTPLRKRTGTGGGREREREAITYLCNFSSLDTQLTFPAWVSCFYTQTHTHLFCYPCEEFPWTKLLMHLINVNHSLHLNNQTFGWFTYLNKISNLLVCVWGRGGFVRGRCTTKSKRYIFLSLWGAFGPPHQDIKHTQRSFKNIEQVVATWYLICGFKIITPCLNYYQILICLYKGIATN